MADNMHNKLLGIYPNHFNKRKPNIKKIALNNRPKSLKFDEYKCSTLLFIYQKWFYCLFLVF